jgi:hypothetical protein
MTVQLYIRRNGSFGARSDDAGGRDTGHDIFEESGHFTVRRANGRLVCWDASRVAAEEAIARDYRASAVMGDQGESR